MNQAEVLNVGWSEVEAWLRSVARDCRFDTIVGVTRCGLPLAAALSALAPEAALAVLARRGPRGDKPPSYDFAADRKARMLALQSTFELTSLPQTASQVLVVDDVATYGDTLFMAREKVRAAAPKAAIYFACYAADIERLRANRADVLQDLHYALAIDNAQTWVSFPWNLEPISR